MKATLARRGGRSRVSAASVRARTDVLRPAEKRMETFVARHFARKERAQPSPVEKRRLGAIGALTLCCTALPTGRGDHTRLRGSCGLKRQRHNP
eukprot:6200338-Pleurochrysis_carterae.AAC.2